MLSAVRWLSYFSCMARKKLTGKFVETVKTDKKRQEFCDTSLEGFGLRVTKKGTKTFFVRFRYRGKQERETIGRYPFYSLADAKDKAREILAEVERGSWNVLYVEALTIRETYDLFIELYAKVHNKDWAVSDSRLKKFMAEFGDMKLTDLHRRDIIAFLDKLVADGTPTQANRARAALSRFLKLSF